MFWFNSGGDAAATKYGHAGAGYMFEKICLWIFPLAKRTINCFSLTDNMISLDPLTLPPMSLLSRHWKTEGKLMPDQLYQPRIANLESGNAFCVLRLNGSFALIILQITIAHKHPMEVNGLKTIYSSFSEEVRLAIERKIIIFVTPIGGKLTALQALHTEKNLDVEGNISPEEDNFEQWILRYNPFT